MLLPCEYCGRLVSWNLKVTVPPCCRGCRWIPLTVGILGLLAIVGCLAALHFALVSP